MSFGGSASTRPAIRIHVEYGDSHLEKPRMAGILLGLIICVCCSDPGAIQPDSPGRLTAMMCAVCDRIMRPPRGRCRRGVAALRSTGLSGIRTQLSAARAHV